MQPGMKQVISLLGGVAFFTAGLVMIFQGIQAEGAIDIQAAVVRGNVRSGSAGLIVTFLATIIIISSLAFSPPSEETQKSKLSSYLWSVTLFLSSMAGVLVAVCRALNLEQNGIGWASVFAFVVCVGVAIIVAVQFDQSR